MENKKNPNLSQIFPNINKLKNEKTFLSNTETETKSNNNTHINSTPKFIPPIDVKIKGRGRPPKKNGVDEDLWDKDSDELWDLMFTENVSPEIFDKKLHEVVKNMPVTSPLEKIRKMLEDRLQINELREIITADRDIKSGIAPQSQQQQQQQTNNQQETNDVINLLTLLSNKNPNLDFSNPLMVSTILGSFSGQRGGSGGMNNPMLLLTMADLLNKTQQSQTQSNGSVQNQPISAELVKEAIKRIEENVNKPAPAVSPDIQQLVLLNNLMGKNSNSDNGQLPMILAEMNKIANSNQAAQFNQMMQSNQQFMANIVEKMNSAIYSLSEKKNPRQEFYESIDVVTKLMGEKRARTDSELKYDYKKEELKDKREARLDQLRITDNVDAREHQKSMEYVNLAGEVVKNLTGGEGIGNIVGSIMSAGGKKKKNMPVMRGNVSNDDLDLL